FVLLVDLRLLELRAVAMATVALATGVTVAAYYFGYLRLCATRGGFVFARAWRPDTGINLSRRRRLVQLVWATLPWVVLAFYCAGAGRSDEPFASKAIPPIGRWAIFPMAIMWVVGVGLIAASLLDSLRESAALQRGVVAAVAALVVAALFANTFEVEAVV